MTAVDAEKRPYAEELELVAMVPSESLRGEKAMNSPSFRGTSEEVRTPDALFEEKFVPVSTVEPSMLRSGTGVEGLGGLGPLAIESGSNRSGT